MKREAATRVAVIVPALNEQDCIGGVVTDILEQMDVTVIVVDNGSEDATAVVARAAGARVVAETRRGYGYACTAGVAAAGDDHDVLVFMDGDGSDCPAELPLLLEPIERDGFDLVLGSRVLGRSEHGAILPHQKVGNMLTVLLIRMLYGQHLTDLPPFKAIRRSVIHSIQMHEMTYGWTVELIVKCAKRKLRILEVPVQHRRRIAGKSKVSGTLRGTLLAAYYLVGTTIKYARRG